MQLTGLSLTNVVFRTVFRLFLTLSFVMLCLSHTWLQENKCVPWNSEFRNTHMSVSHCLKDLGGLPEKCKKNIDFRFSWRKQVFEFGPLVDMATLKRWQQTGQWNYEWRNASHFDSTPCIRTKLFGWSWGVFAVFLGAKLALIVLTRWKNPTECVRSDKQSVPETTLGVRSS